MRQYNIQMHALRRNRQLALIPAILWLAAQLAMTGLFTGPASAALSALSAGQALSIVELCTPDGFRLIALDVDGQPAQDRTGGTACEWCQSFGQSILPVAGSEFRGVPTPYLVKRQQVPDDDRADATNTPAAYDTRAPPFSN